MRIIGLDQFFYYALGASMVYTITSLTGSFWLGMIGAMLGVLVVTFVVERLINKQVLFRNQSCSPWILTFSVNLIGVCLVKYI